MEKTRLFLVISAGILAAFGAFATKANAKYNTIGYYFTSSPLGNRCVAYTADCVGGDNPTYTGPNCCGAVLLYEQKISPTQCGPNALCTTPDPCRR